MSLVEPRPNVLSEVEMYTNKENKLLNVKPGITDFSSIIFLMKVKFSEIKKTQTNHITYL